MIPLVPTKKQVETIRGILSSHVAALSGAVRSGKTASVFFVFPMLIKIHYDENILIGAKTLRNIEENILSPLRNMYGSANVSRIINKCECYIFGKRCLCIPFNNELAVGKIQGLSIGLAICDEIVLSPQAFFNMLLTRLDTPDFRFVFTCNPSSPNHYVKRYIDDEKVPKFKAHFTLYDNPTLPEVVVKNLENSFKDSPVFFRRFILGEWCNADGLACYNFDRAIHTEKIEEVDTSWIINNGEVLVYSIDPANTSDKTAGIPVLFFKDGSDKVLKRFVYDPKKNGARSNIEQLKMMRLNIWGLMNDERIPLNRIYGLRKVMLVDGAAADMLLNAKYMFERDGWTVIGFTKKDLRKTLDIMNNNFCNNKSKIVVYGEDGDYDYYKNEYYNREHLIEELESVKIEEKEGKVLLDDNDPNDSFDGYRYAEGWYHIVDDGNN